MLSDARLAEIDELFRRDAASWYSAKEAARDLRAEVTRLRKQADWYETRCVNYGTFVSERDATIERLRIEVQKWQRIRTPTHGTCCTCQACGEHHDDCRCDLDDVADRAAVAEAEVERLKLCLKLAEARSDNPGWNG